MLRYLLCGFLGLLAAMSVQAQGTGKYLKAGIIGLDTSHVVAFTKILNNPNAPPHLTGVKIVAAFKGGSPDVKSSADRIDKFTETMQKELGIEIVDSIDKLLEKVDVVLIESVDGRPHLKQVLPVFQAGKPVFIDKPVAGSLSDVLAIFFAAKKYKVPCFTSSSLRFDPAVVAMRDPSKVGKVMGCEAFSPCSLEAHHPDLFWYGVHGMETLYTIMGTGCESVSRVQTPDYELAVGKWKDGRIGSFRGLRGGKTGYGALVYGDKGIQYSPASGGYEPLVAEIVKFFKTGQAPVSAEETIEMFAFMEAADESKRQGGAPVTIASVIEKAQKQIEKEK